MNKVLILFIALLPIIFSTCKAESIRKRENASYIERYIGLFRNYLKKDWIKENYFKNLEDVKEAYRRYSIETNENYAIRHKQELVKRIVFDKKIGLIKYGSQAHGIIEYPTMEYVFQNGDILFSETFYEGGAGRSLYNISEDKWIRDDVEGNASHLALQYKIIYDNTEYLLQCDPNTLSYFIKDDKKKKIVLDLTFRRWKWLNLNKSG